MLRTVSTARWSRTLGALALAIGISTAGFHFLGSSAAAAQGETDEAELRAYWQGRYRSLRKKEARLVETVKLATKEYADSNRRTYRRSGVRHFHRTNANEAKAELETVRAEIASLYDEASAAGVPIFWLDEVAEEPIDPAAVEGLGVYRDDGPFGGKGAYARDSDDEDPDAEPEGADDGRNPLYTGAGDEPASLEGDGSKKFDYEAWRTNREAYEQERAPERHLDPGWAEPAEDD